MKPIILLVYLAALVNSYNITHEEGVLVLTEENFDEVVMQHEYILVNFYAAWCGHCKKLAPEYAKAAQALAKETPPIVLAKVDATVHKELTKKYEVRGYPTLKLFINGEPTEYKGGRVDNEIISYLKKKTGPPTTLVVNAEEIEAFKNHQDVFVVYFGDNKEDIAIFQKLAKMYEDFYFGISSSVDAYEKYQVKERTVVLFKKFDETRNDFVDPLKLAELRPFIAKSSKPLVRRWSDKFAQIIFHHKTPGLFFFRDPHAEKTPEYDRIFHDIAEKAQGRIQFLTCGISDGDDQRLASYIGVTETEIPSLRIIDTRTDIIKYKMEGEFSESTVLKFIDDWEKGKLFPLVKTQEIPERQEGDVYVVVGKSFEDVVLKSDKDVLLELYSPWCENCKQFAPIYDELAAKLKHNTQLLIAKMDTTENEVLAVKPKGLPTIIFFPSGKKNAPLYYEREMTAEGLIKYIEERATHPVKATKEEL